MTRKTTRKTRQSAAPAASAAVPPAGAAPGAIAITLDDLEVAEGLLSTAHSALSAEDANTDGAQVTLGLALERLRAGMERVRAMRPTQD